MAVSKGLSERMWVSRGINAVADMMSDGPESEYRKLFEACMEASAIQNPGYVMAGSAEAEVINYYMGSRLINRIPGVRKLFDKASSGAARMIGNEAAAEGIRAVMVDTTLDTAMFTIPQMVETARNGGSVGDVLSAGWDETKWNLLMNAGAASLFAGCRYIRNLNKEAVKAADAAIDGFDSFSPEVKEVMNLWKEADISSFNKLTMEERNIYIKAIQNEGRITPELQEIVLNNGGYLDGLEHRIKSPSSVFEKIYLRPESTPILEMNDIVRYTEIQDAADLAETTQKTISDLETQGYEIIKLKNTWIDETNPYKGINAQVKSPEGQIFEIQFHTPESFALKNSAEMHGLYEQARVTTDSMEAMMLKNKMFDLSSTLKKPKNIEQIENIEK